MIVLYDGICNLCDRTVQFVLKHDTQAKIRFAALQSTYARVLLQQNGVPLSDPPTSLLIFSEGQIFQESTAALKILRALPSPWKYLYGLILIPRPIRDLVYRFVARHRYQWFGREAQCILPRPEWKSRFIDSE